VLRVVSASESIVDMAAVREALERVTDLVCTLIASSPDGDRVVGESDWTVCDVAAHLVIGSEAYVRYADGADEPLFDVSDIAGGSLARSSAARLDAEPERDPVVLADRLRAGSQALLEATVERDRNEVVVWNGMPIALGDMLGIGLAEYLLHGLDIAQALSRDWTIRPDDARLVLASALQLLPLLVDPQATAGVHARYDLRVRGGLRRTVTIDDGELTVTVEPTRVDCHVSADPVALLLIAYGRRAQWVPILTGRLLAWGRKPWLGPRLVRYLVTP
jgi:uncharacterized protein (TIGR03083 family)